MELALEVLLAPFVACLVLTGIHAYLGLHVVSRGVIFVDLALAQIAALGATYAFLVGYDPSGTGGYIYSLIFAFVGAAIFSFSRLKKQKIPQEAIIGITFAVASATAILIADRSPQGSEFIEAMLTGALLWVPWSKIGTTALVYAAIGLFHWVFRRRFLTISLEPELAEREGWNVRGWDFLFYISFGLVITLSVSIAGVLLVFSFLVIPAVIGMMFSHSIVQRLVVGWSVATLVSMLGLTLSYAFDFPSGPAVVATFGAALALASLVRFLLNAERLAPALAKVAATIVVAAGALWLSLATASVGGRHVDEPPGAAVATDPATRATEALAQLAASTGEPPQAAVTSLLEVGDVFHEMMSAGRIEVSEAAVEALGRVPDGDQVSELLEEIAFHAENPWARLRGAEALLAYRSPLGVVPLIDLMDSDAPVFLMLQAAEALHAATGQDFGFDPQADATSRAEAIAQWRAWWQVHRAEPLPEPQGEM